jgi:hypothetical protein
MTTLALGLLAAAASAEVELPPFPIERHRRARIESHAADRVAKLVSDESLEYSSAAWVPAPP